MRLGEKLTMINSEAKYMIVNSRTIRRKAGAGSMLLNFIKNHYPLPATNGFVNIEILTTSGIDDTEEITIRTIWKTIDDYETWVQANQHKLITSIENYTKKEMNCINKGGLQTIIIGSKINSKIIN